MREEFGRSEAIKPQQCGCLFNVYQPVCVAVQLGQLLSIRL